MMDRVGLVLGLSMNRVKLRKINFQIRFQSSYFLKKNEPLIHGAEICAEFLEAMNLAKQIADEKKRLVNYSHLSL